MISLLHGTVEISYSWSLFPSYRDKDLKSVTEWIAQDHTAKKWTSALNAWAQLHSCLTHGHTAPSGSIKGSISHRWGASHTFLWEPKKLGLLIPETDGSLASQWQPLDFLGVIFAAGESGLAERGLQDLCSNCRGTVSMEEEHFLFFLF